MEDIQKLFRDLKEAKNQYDEVFDTQTRIEKELIAEEVELLKQIAEPLFEVGEIKEIHALDSILLFDFKEQEKTLISPLVYYSKDGKIKYEVYDEEKYRRHRRNAWIVDGWNIMQPEEFLQYVTLERIFEFLNERPSELYNRSESFVDFNKSRREFIHNLKNILK